MDGGQRSFLLRNAPFHPLTAERKPPRIQYEGLEMKAQQFFEFNNGLIFDPPLA